MNVKPSATVVAVLGASVLFVACDRAAETRMGSGERDSSTMSRGEEKAAEVKEDIRQGVDDATAAVNAKLVGDAKLSALRIDVDTQDSRVVLRGAAPESASRERATSLAAGVDGVTAVDNQLVVGSKG